MLEIRVEGLEESDACNGSVKTKKVGSSVGKSRELGINYQ